MLNQRKSDRLDFYDDKASFTASDPGLAPHYTVRPVIDYSESGIVSDPDGMQHYESMIEGDRREKVFFHGIIIGLLLSIPAWIFLIGLGMFLYRRWFS